MIEVSRGVLDIDFFSKIVFSVTESEDTEIVSIRMSITTTDGIMVASDNIYAIHGYDFDEIRKDFFNFLDNDQLCRFLPRFKCEFNGQKFHLDRERSREIYDELKRLCKTSSEIREETINKIIDED